MSCLFCDIQNTDKVVVQNDLAFAIFDGFPVSDGHALIIPKRHAETYFDLTDDEVVAMKELAMQMKQIIIEKYHPIGFNVGFNCGMQGGQTIFHAHMHIIPRYEGDIENPRGGIRNIIKSKTKY